MDYFWDFKSYYGVFIKFILYNVSSMCVCINLCIYLFVCVYVYIYLYMCACVSISMYVCMYIGSPSK